MHTRKYFFFWTGICSNFYPIDGDESKTSEKMYMAQKALFFQDYDSLSKILNAQTPREAKQLGRKVKNFDQKSWDSVKLNAMLFALKWKLTVCPEFKEILAKHASTHMFIEASPYDRIWGIGFSEKDALDNVPNWGENLLGECLNITATYLNLNLD